MPLSHRCGLILSCTLNTLPCGRRSVVASQLTHVHHQPSELCRPASLPLAAHPIVHSGATGVRAALSAKPTRTEAVREFREAGQERQSSPVRTREQCYFADLRLRRGRGRGSESVQDRRRDGCRSQGASCSPVGDSKPSSSLSFCYRRLKGVCGCARSRRVGRRRTSSA